MSCIQTRESALAAREKSRRRHAGRVFVFHDQRLTEDAG